MAVTILKKTPIHCVIKVTEAGTYTITLNSLATSAQTPSSPKANITALTWSVPSGNATVVRNSKQLWAVTGAFAVPMIGWSDTEQNGSDLVVTIPVGGGTVVIEVVKVSGYGDEQHRNQESGVG